MATVNIIQVEWKLHTFSINGVKYPIIIGKAICDNTPVSGDTGNIRSYIRNELSDFVNTGILTICGVTVRGYGSELIADKTNYNHVIDGNANLTFIQTKETNRLHHSIYLQRSGVTNLIMEDSSTWGWGTNNRMSIGVGAIIYDGASDLILHTASCVADSIYHTTTSSNPNPDGVISYENVIATAHITKQTNISDKTGNFRDNKWSDIKDCFTEYKSNADPYTEGGTSEPGGGGGSFDDSTDVITIPEYDPVDLLNRSYGNRGFVHVYLPTQAELTTLHAFMWDNSLVTDMQKMFGNVADAIISLNLIPLDFTDATPNRGNILMGLVDSQIETTIAKQQFVTLDCGTIEIDEFFASYLDYSPYSKLQIYLPYIGVKDLDIDEFMNAYISVKYVIDIVSGDCVAFISKTGAIDNAVVKDNPILGVLYQFAGNCALNVPISGSNYAQMHAADIGALISGAGVLGNFLTGGMSAPSAVTGILSTAANVVTSKPSVSRGGAVSSTVGYMSIQKPYLILTRPRMCLPEDQNTFTGYPAYVTMTPGDTSGYTEFEIIHLENIPATDAEKNELETLMKTGVIL